MTLLLPEIQVALTALKALRPIETELHYARKAGLELIIPAEIETEYVNEHGVEGQRFIDVLLGRIETMASVNFKVLMKLED